MRAGRRLSLSSKFIWLCYCIYFCDRLSFVSVSLFSSSNPLYVFCSARLFLHLVIRFFRIALISSLHQYLLIYYFFGLLVSVPESISHMFSYWLAIFVSLKNFIKTSKVLNEIDWETILLRAPIDWFELLELTFEIALPHNEFVMT